MAKDLTLMFNGKDSVFSISSIDRSDLYGKRRRVQLDGAGNPCTRVAVTLDGSITLRSGMTGQGYFLPDGGFVKQAQLETYDAEGRLLEKKPSSFAEPQAIEGPVPPEDLLDTRISTVYVLAPVELDDQLKRALGTQQLLLDAEGRPMYASPHIWKLPLMPQETRSVAKRLQAKMSEIYL